MNDKAYVVLKRVFLITLSVLPIVLIVAASGQFMAYHYYINAGAKMKQVAASGNELSAKEADNILLLSAKMQTYDPINPNYRMYDVQLKRWIEYQLGNRNLDSQTLYMSLEAANQVRPIEAKQYVEQAVGLWREGEDIENVIAYFRTADKFGKYDPIVVKQSFEFYVANWADLKVDDKVMALDYFVDTPAYGISSQVLLSSLGSESNRERACFLFKNYSPNEVDC